MCSVFMVSQRDGSYHIAPSSVTPSTFRAMNLRPDLVSVCLKAATSLAITRQQVVLVKPTVCNYAVIDAIVLMPVGNASVVAYLLQPTVADSHHYTGNKKNTQSQQVMDALGGLGVEVCSLVFITKLFQSKPQVVPNAFSQLPQFVWKVGLGHAYVLVVTLTCWLL